jgi:hypothetical protein
VICVTLAAKLAACQTATERGGVFFAENGRGSILFLLCSLSPLSFFVEDERLEQAEKAIVSGDIDGRIGRGNKT